MLGAGGEAAKNRSTMALLAGTAASPPLAHPPTHALPLAAAQTKRVVSPTDTLLVVDAMTGQEAAGLVKSFNDAVDITGAVLTKMDGDSRGGAALSIKEVRRVAPACGWRSATPHTRGLWGGLPDPSPWAVGVAGGSAAAACRVGPAGMPRLPHKPSNCCARPPCVCTRLRMHHLSFVPPPPPQVSGRPIKFVGTGEKMEALEPFYPDRMASRILGEGRPPFPHPHPHPHPAGARPASPACRGTQGRRRGRRVGWWPGLFAVPSPHVNDSCMQPRWVHCAPPLDRSC